MWNTALKLVGEFLIAKYLRNRILHAGDDSNNKHATNLVQSNKAWQR